MSAMKPDSLAIRKKEKNPMAKRNKPETINRSYKSSSSRPAVWGEYNKGKGVNNWHQKFLSRRWFSIRMPIRIFEKNNILQREAGKSRETNKPRIDAAPAQTNNNNGRITNLVFISKVGIPVSTDYKAIFFRLSHEDHWREGGSVIFRWQGHPFDWMTTI